MVPNQHTIIMKITNSFGKDRQLVLCFFTVISLFFMSSCAKKIVFQNSPIVPAARGTITLTTDKNKNNVIDVNLQYLAEPNRLTPPMKVYVVWMSGTDNMNHNIGQVRINTGFMSKGLKGSFRTVSSSKPQRIFVTAEIDAGVTNPSNMVVLTTNNF